MFWTERVKSLVLPPLLPRLQKALLSPRPLGLAEGLDRQVSPGVKMAVSRRPFLTVPRLRNFGPLSPVAPTAPTLCGRAL